MTKICMENFIEAVGLRAGQDCDWALAHLLSAEIEWRDSGEIQMASNWILICMMVLDGNPIKAQEVLANAGLVIEERAIVFPSTYFIQPYKATGFCLMIDITHPWVNSSFSGTPYTPATLLKLPGAGGRDGRWISVPLWACLNCLKPSAV